jgi:transglutaminase-like putative cysteine protease
VQDLHIQLDQLVTVDAIDFNVRTGNVDTPATRLDSPAFQEPLPGHWGRVDYTTLDFVAAKSADLVSPSDSPLQRAKKIFLFIKSEIRYVPDEIEADSMEEVLQIVLRDKKANCAPQSFLFVALCRTNPVPIPARVVCGHLTGAGLTGASTHHWVEFYIEGMGWIPVDMTIRTSEPLYWFGHTGTTHLATRAITTLPPCIEHLWQLSSYKVEPAG